MTLTKWIHLGLWPSGDLCEWVIQREREREALSCLFVYSHVFVVFCQSVILLIEANTLNRYHTKLLLLIIRSLTVSQRMKVLLSQSAKSVYCQTVELLILLLFVCVCAWSSICHNFRRQIFFFFFFYQKNTRAEYSIRIKLSWSHVW